MKINIIYKIVEKEDKKMIKDRLEYVYRNKNTEVFLKEILEIRNTILENRIKFQDEKLEVDVLGKFMRLLSNGADVENYEIWWMMKQEIIEKKPQESIIFIIDNLHILFDEKAEEEIKYMCKYFLYGYKQEFLQALIQCEEKNVNYFIQELEKKANLKIVEENFQFISLESKELLEKYYDLKSK